MKDAIYVEVDDIKQILADHFKVDVKDVIKNQYTYIIIKDNDEEEKPLT